MTTIGRYRLRTSKSINRLLLHFNTNMNRSRTTKPSRFHFSDIYNHLRPSFLSNPNSNVTNNENQTDPLLTPTTSPTNNSITDQQPSRLFNTTLPVVILLITIAFLSTPYLFSEVPRFLRPASFLGAANQFKSTATGIDGNRINVREGVSIITACKDRHSVLARSLGSWLKVLQVNEIIIVDWSSSPPLEDTIHAVIDVEHTPSTTTSAVQIIRVDSESKWVYSRAFNLAAKASSYHTLLKLDCDVVVDLNIVKAHPLQTKTQFYSGDKSLSRSANDFALQGIMLIPRHMLLSIGGHDERIQTYGYECNDVYNRLSNMYQRHNLSYEYLQHVSHHDKTKTQSEIQSFPYIQSHVNQQLLNSISIPWSLQSNSSKYIYNNEENDENWSSSYTPPSLESLLDKQFIKSLFVQFIKERLYNRYKIPIAIIENMNIYMLEKFQRNLDAWNDGSKYDEVLHPENIPPFVIIHVQNGIGNRLRVLGSGLAFARLTDREPIVIWEEDVHFNATFDQLFDISQVQYPVIDTFKYKWPLDELQLNDSAWNNINLYNYMLDVNNNPEIINENGKSIYFNSSSIMQSDIIKWEDENIGILELPILTEISEIVNQTSLNFEGKNVGGVHIRNRSLDNDIDGVDDNRKLYNNRSMEDIDKWRAFTKMYNFIPTIKHMLNNHTVDSFFVTSDTFQVCEQLQTIFGKDRIFFINRGSHCDDRSSKCLKFALADLLVLAKTKPLLGSTWSSFTEAAMRLGGPKALLAGTDFGDAPNT